MSKVDGVLLCRWTDGSVNQGGKITSNLYVWMHIFVLLDVCFFFLKEEQFSKKIFDL